MEHPKIKVHAVFLMLLVMGAAMLPSLASADESESFLLRKIEAPKPKEKKPSPKLDFIFNASRTYLWTGTSLDMATTVQALNHPSVARRGDGTFLMNYPGHEAGIMGGPCGGRNTGCVVATNVALNLGVDFLSGKLYRKGGRWRYAAIVLRLYKGTDNMMGGFHNIEYSGSLDQRIRQVTGYTGHVVWTRH